MTKNRIFPLWLLWLTIPAVVVIAGPMLGLLLNIPWNRAWQLVAASEVQTAMWLSIGTTAVATCGCVLLGVPLALGLTYLQRRWPGMAQGIQLFVYAPLVLSPVVSGLALVYFWGRHGVMQPLLDAGGISVAYTPFGVIVVQIFVSMPFVVATAVTALGAVPRQLEDAAAVDGASRSTTMRTIVLPLAWPGIAVGVVLAFARSLGEYGATLTFAGNVAGKTQTIPLLIELGLSSNDMDRALGACLVLLAVYVFVVGGIVALRLYSQHRSTHQLKADTSKP